MQQTTSSGLQARRDAPLIPPAAAESLNATHLPNAVRGDGAMPRTHSGSGYHLRKESRLSAHPVFVMTAVSFPMSVRELREHLRDGTFKWTVKGVMVEVK